MKKTFASRILILVLTLSLLLPVLTGCIDAKTLRWQKVALENCGTLKLPPDWVCYKKDGLVYILDGSQRPVMIQTQCWADPDGNHADPESNDFYQNVTNLRILTSAVFSNGAIYGTYLTEHNGSTSTKYYLHIGYPSIIRLLVWDKTIDEEMLITIAKTFEHA